jgi:hypothetical protein
MILHLTLNSKQFSVFIDVISTIYSAQLEIKTGSYYHQKCAPEDNL